MRRRLLAGFGLLALLMMIALMIAVSILDRRVTEQFEGRRWTLPARVYAQPLDLYVGQSLSAERMATELRRLGYLQTESTDRPGSFHRKGNRIDAHVREFRFTDGLRPSAMLRIVFGGNAITSLRDGQGSDLPVYRLDPMLIGSIFPIHGEDRIVVSPSEVPPLLPAALMAIEDRKFEEHHGISPLAIVRAALVNLRAGKVEQGGSTLTQQLVKSYFLDSRRTLRRKLEEAVMAMSLEYRFEKDDIMNAYINEIYLGQDGRRAVHGFGLASQFYFGKPLAELELHQIALMVGLVRGPSYYDPRRHPERSLEHRNLVLEVLAEQGVISEAAAEDAAGMPLEVTGSGSQGASFYPAFLDLVRRQLRDDYHEEDLTEAGLVVLTTLDPLLQEKAEQALAAELERQDQSSREDSHGLEGVVVVTSPQTGEVVAIVGGRRAAFDGFNRALDAKRPIGSLAKPLVYLTALETGNFTPATLIADEAVQLDLPNGTRWEPQNFNRQTNGPVTVLRGLSQSLNLATVNLGLEVGLEPVADTFVELGLGERPAAYASMLLGATNLSPLEVTQMYNTLANGGFRSPLRAVVAVLDEHGGALKAPELEMTPVKATEQVYVVDRMLIEVMQRGTGRAAKRQLPATLTVAGKTGTSNDYRDSWFAGFSGSHLIVVWVGHDDNSSTGLTGTTGALPVWTKLMSSIMTTPFEPLMPEQFEDRWIDFFTGTETSPYCTGTAVLMPFRIGALLAPNDLCSPGESALDETTLMLRQPPVNGGNVESATAPRWP